MSVEVESIAKTLNEVQKQFRNSPRSDELTAEYLHIALKYWRDDEITDDAMIHIMVEVLDRGFAGTSIPLRK